MENNMTKVTWENTKYYTIELDKNKEKKLKEKYNNNMELYLLDNHKNFNSECKIIEIEVSLS